MNGRYDLCINGAGPVGAALACRLAQEGMRVLLLDRAPAIGEKNPALDGRAYAVAEGARRLLDETGIWDNLPHPPQPIRTIHVLDGRPGADRPSPFLDLTPQDAPEGRNFGWMIEANDLLLAISHTVQQYEMLDLRAPETGHFTFNEDHVDIRLSSGLKAQAALAVAAEGRNSPLRRQARIGVTRIPYHKYAIVSVIAHERPHQDAALEHFLPQGPFARLPLPPTAAHPHRSAVVWTDTEARIRRFMDVPDAVFTREVTARLGTEELGAVTLIGRRWLYPLAAQYAQRYVAQRLALAGDSAHGLHPVAGQGLNAGFRDVMALVRILSDAFHQKQDLGAPDLLLRYQRATRAENLTMLAACDAMERLFSNDNPLLRRVRGLGLAGLNRLPTLRRAFVRRAMGL